MSWSALATEEPDSPAHYRDRFLGSHHHHGHASTYSRHPLCGFPHQQICVGQVRRLDQPNLLYNLSNHRMFTGDIVEQREYLRH